MAIPTSKRNPHLSPHKMVGFSGMLRNNVGQKASVSAMHFSNLRTNGDVLGQDMAERTGLEPATPA